MEVYQSVVVETIILISVITFNYDLSLISSEILKFIQVSMTKCEKISYLKFEITVTHVGNLILEVYSSQDVSSKVVIKVYSSILVSPSDISILPDDSFDFFIESGLLDLLFSAENAKICRVDQTRVKALSSGFYYINISSSSAVGSNVFQVKVRVLRQTALLIISSSEYVIE
jgi:hypothetical protein